MVQKGFRRADRVSERIRSELMEILLRGGMRDPAAKDVVISAVRMTDDLSIARVVFLYYRQSLLKILFESPTIQLAY